MLHLRTTIDVAPTAGAASRRTHLSRTALDQAPAEGDAVLVQVFVVSQVLSDLLFNVGLLLLLAEGEIEARGPPEARR